MTRAFVVFGVLVASTARADSILDRAYPLRRGQLALVGTTGVAALPLPGIDPITVEPALLGVAFGVGNALTLGASYAVITHDPGGWFPRDDRSKGAAVVHAIVGLARGRLTLAAGAQVTFDVAAETQELSVGMAARWRVASRVALFAGAPFGPEPVARELSFTRHDVAFDLPLGAGIAANRCLFVYAASNVVDLGAAVGLRGALGRHLDLALRAELPDARDRDVYRVTAGLVFYR